MCKKFWYMDRKIEILITNDDSVKAKGINTGQNDDAVRKCHSGGTC